MMGWYGDGAGWGGWVMMTVWMLGFWGLLGAGAVVLYRALRRDESHRGGEASAERLLDERFARGEIGVEEYRERRELLRPGR